MQDYLFTLNWQPVIFGAIAFFRKKVPPPRYTSDVPPEAPSILNSWKEIASYLGRGVRTVQRWHNTLHLPVHQIKPGSRKGPVFAYKNELDRWMNRQARHGFAEKIDRHMAATQENRDKVSAIRRRLNSWRTASKTGKRAKDTLEEARQLGFTFMSNDLDAALILAEMAERSWDRSRTEANARRALDTVLKLYRKTKLTDEERTFLDGKIAKVRAVLERIGSQQRSE